MRRRAIAPTGEEVTGKQYLLSIGINSYLHWPQLKTAVNDAREVTKVLISRYHFEAADAVSLYDAEGTRDNIIGNLRRLASNLRSEDSLLIYYAGHGHLDKLTGTGSWIPVESKRKNAAAWISNHSIKECIRACKARHILVVSDSCFSGDFFRSKREDLPEVTEEWIKKAYGLISRQAITSGGLEPVSDAGFAGHSVFSYFFLDALKQNRRAYLLPSELYGSVKKGVVANAEQVPEYGSLKDTGGHHGGEYVLFRRVSGAAPEWRKQLARLQEVEAAQQREREKRAQQETKMQERVAQIKKQIKALEERFGVSSQAGDLDRMLAMVKEKEATDAKLKQLEEERRRREAEMQAEMARLRQEQERQVQKQLRASVAKYRRIVESKYGRNLKDRAWQALVSSCPPWWQAGSVAKYRTDLLLQGPETRQQTLAREQRERREAERREAERREAERREAERREREARKWRQAGFTYLRTGTYSCGGQRHTVKEYRHDKTGLEFVLIPGGSFAMGSNDYNSEKPVHEVRLSSFLLSKTEVTQAVWQRIMKTTPWQGKSYVQEGANNPAVYVSWEDAVAFCKQTGLCLPTEAQWEYACRAGTTTKYYWGDSMDGAYCWYAGNAWNKDEQYAHQVGQKQANAFGLYDMSGNVWEWCQDWYDDSYYSKGENDNPRGPSTGSSRVLRGGSFVSVAGYCRSADRNCYGPGRRVYRNGVRFAAQCRTE